MTVTKIGLGRPSKSQTYQIGTMQYLMLSFIASHPNAAHGAGIARHLREAFKPSLSDAQVYVALKRMEARGYVKAIKSDRKSNAVRSRGRPIKTYVLKSSGTAAMKYVDAGSVNMPEILGKGKTHEYKGRKKGLVATS